MWVEGDNRLSDWNGTIEDVESFRWRRRKKRHNPMSRRALVVVARAVIIKGSLKDLLDVLLLEGTPRVPPFSGLPETTIAVGAPSIVVWMTSMKCIRYTYYLKKLCVHAAKDDDGSGNIMRAEVTVPDLGAVVPAAKGSTLEELSFTIVTGIILAGAEK